MTDTPPFDPPTGITTALRALDELDAAYRTAKTDPEFQARFAGLLRDYAGVPYPMATEADLAETVKAVEALDRRIVATVADVRDAGALKAAVDDGAGNTIR